MKKLVLKTRIENVGGKYFMLPSHYKTSGNWVKIPISIRLWMASNREATLIDLYISAIKVMDKLKDEKTKEQVFQFVRHFQY